MKITKKNRLEVLLRAFNTYNLYGNIAPTQIRN